MDFIVNEVMKFKHINAADSDAVLERFASPAVVEDSFAVRIHTGKFHSSEKVGIICAVENGSGDKNAGISGFRQPVMQQATICALPSRQTRKLPTL